MLSSDILHRSGLYDIHHAGHPPNYICVKKDINIHVWSGVVDVWCVGCFNSQCGGCLVWWTSGVVDVCVVDVVQSWQGTQMN